jgi:hypothetical protein
MSGTSSHEFFVNKVTVEQLFLLVDLLQVSLLSIFAPMVHTHSIIYYLRCIILETDIVKNTSKQDEHIHVSHDPPLSPSPLYIYTFRCPLLPFLSHRPLPKVAFYSRRVILWEALQRGLAGDGLWSLAGSAHGLAA